MNGRQMVNSLSGDGSEGTMKENCLQRMERIDSKRRIADFMVKEKQDYTFKKKYATIRAIEFAEECDKRGLNYHVSGGGGSTA